jgi:hypothetical protein
MSNLVKQDNSSSPHPNTKWLDNAALIAGRSYTIHGDATFGVDIGMCHGDARFGGFFSSLVSVITAPAKAAVSVTKAVVNTASEVVKHVPIVGKPISSVLQVPGLNAIDSVLSGQRIDKAILGELSRQIQVIREVGPLASSIVSMVPGVGTGVAAGIGAASALINGQPIDQALVSAVRSALPGGALAQAAFDVAKTGIQGGNVLKATLNSIPSLMLKQLPSLPSQLKILQDASAGLKVPQAVVNKALSYVPEQARKAFTIGIALGQAQKVQKQTNSVIKKAVPPVKSPAKIAAPVVKAVAKSAVPTPPKVDLFSKYIAAGKQFIAKSPGYGEGLKALKTLNAKLGYWYGLGVMSQSGMNRIYLQTFRNNLPLEEQRNGFDIALSARVGAATKVAPAAAPPAVQFAYYATQGMKAAPTRVEQAKTIIQTAPEMKAGVAAAVNDIQVNRKTVWQKVKEFFGFHGETICLGEFE